MWLLQQGASALSLVFLILSFQMHVVTFVLRSATRCWADNAVYSLVVRSVGLSDLIAACRVQQALLAAIILALVLPVSSSVLLIAVPGCLKLLATAVSWSLLVNASLILLLVFLFCTIAFGFFDVGVVTGHSGSNPGQDRPFRFTPWTGPGIQVQTLDTPGHSGSHPGQDRPFRFTPWTRPAIQVHTLDRTGHSGSHPGQDRPFRFTPWTGPAIQVQTLDRTGHSGSHPGQDRPFRFTPWTGPAIQVQPLDRPY
jgi:hypothetical protein